MIHANKKWGGPVLYTGCPVHTHTLVRGRSRSLSCCYGVCFASVAFIRDTGHFILSLQHIFYPGGVVWRWHWAPHVLPWGNQLAVALLVGEGIRRAAGARPAYSPQGLLLRAFTPTGELHLTNLTSTAVGQRAAEGLYFSQWKKTVDVWSATWSSFFQASVGKTKDFIF